MAAELVVPFRKSKGAKNDRNDAQAILSAVQHTTCVLSASNRSTTRRSWHGIGCARVGAMSAQPLISRIRGLMAEFGVWIGRAPRNR